MKNILIFTENASSNLESLLKQKENYFAQTKSNNEIKEAAAINPDLIILDGSSASVQNILAVNKFPAPVLIAVENVIDGAIVRADFHDYVLKPIKENEFFVRVANMLKIKELKDEVKTVSNTDELTGLHNRKYIHERLEAELSRAKRYGTALSCILLDIDFFKVVNDIYGYDWGDILLKQLSEVMKKHVRLEDILTRYGDEEFLIVLPNTDEDNAYLFAERLRKDIEAMQFIPEGEEERHPITISGGISSFPFLENVDESSQSLIRYAEHALYNAKKRGKNKMVQFSQINIDF